jgi:peptide/nickel transport system ATP-binding protein
MLLADTVAKRFRTPAGVLVALDGVSLAVAPGSRLGLAGRSGSGKSTLARVLALLLAPDEGVVRVDGEEVRRYGLRAPQELRRRVQLVWQSPRTAADPRVRLRDLVLEPLLTGAGERPDPSARAAALERWAPRVGLTGELLDRFPHEVSDGQLQRACLARALVVEPRYLVCDEPTSMLDVSTQAALLRAIADVQRETGLGVLLITHDLALARHWCQGVIHIEQGVITPVTSAGAGEAGRRGAAVGR